MRFFAGRYGIDPLNNFIFFLGIFILIVYMFAPYRILNFVYLILFVLYVFRSMSKNYYARQKENAIYVRIKTKWIHSFKAIQKNFKEKEYKHFCCPNCTQIVRVPTGRGKVEITCPNCRTRFTKKA